MAWLLLVLNAIAKVGQVAALMCWIEHGLFCFAIMLVITANIRVGAALMMAISLRD